MCSVSCASLAASSEWSHGGDWLLLGGSRGPQGTGHPLGVPWIPPAILLLPASCLGMNDRTEYPDRLTAHPELHDPL